MFLTVITDGLSGFFSRKSREKKIGNARFVTLPRFRFRIALSVVDGNAKERVIDYDLSASVLKRDRRREAIISQMIEIVINARLCAKW